MSDLRQSPCYAHYLQSQGWQVIKIPQLVYIRHLSFIGSLIKIQRPQGQLDFSKIDHLAKKHHSLFVKFEPSYLSAVSFKLLADNGFFLSPSPLLPTKTVLLDLTQSENQLLKSMSKKSRSCLEKAAKNNLIITQLNPRTTMSFYQSFEKFRKGYLPSPKEFQSLVNSFGQKAFLFTAHQHFKNYQLRSDQTSDFLAGALFLIAHQTAYYFYAFSSPQGRQKLAQYYLLWRSIQKFKKIGLKTLDLEGISDPGYRFTQKWRGFSHFKKSFGGQAITFPGCFIKYYHPLFRFLSSLGFKI